jgi:hypothetical protein
MKMLRISSVAGKSKFRNKKIIVDDFNFDSKKEAKRWSELKLMEKAGIIYNLQKQVSFELVPAVILNGRKKPALRYVADFVYQEKYLKVIEDVKSTITRKNPVYRIKLHLMKAILNLDVKEY